jgi:hypothetical protein
MVRTWTRKLAGEARKANGDLSLRTVKIFLIALPRACLLMGGGRRVDRKVEWGGGFFCSFLIGSSGEVSQCLNIE